jgi:hypothetical protein
VRLSRQQSVVTCDACERNLLLGEEVITFWQGASHLQVCALCEADASARGWRREGAPPPTPVLMPPRGTLLERFRGRRGRRQPVAATLPVAPPRPTVVRLTQTDAPQAERARQRHETQTQLAAQAVEDAIAVFNASAYQRIVHGIAKSLGHPRVSILPLRGTRPDVIVTVAWDLSWYQYRVDPQFDPAVRLQGRGDDIAELDPRWCAWNAQLADSGQLDLGLRPEPDETDAGTGRAPGISGG